MIEKTLYYADDGKKFENKEECIKYENGEKLSIYKKELYDLTVQRNHLNSYIQIHKANVGGAFSQVENKIAYWKSEMRKHSRWHSSSKKYQYLKNDIEHIVDLYHIREAYKSSIKKAKEERNRLNIMINDLRKKIEK